MTTRPEITLFQFDILARTTKPLAVSFGRAILTADGDGDDRRFIMTGPSGCHSLLVAATDIERLLAHWTVFATAEANRTTA